MESCSEESRYQIAIRRSLQTGNERKEKEPFRRNGAPRGDAGIHKGWLVSVLTAA